MHCRVHALVRPLYLLCARLMMPEIEGEGIGRSPLVTALDKPPHGAKSMAPSWGDPSQNLTHALCTKFVGDFF